MARRSSCALAGLALLQQASAVRMTAMDVDLVSNLSPEEAKMVEGKRPGSLLEPFLARIGLEAGQSTPGLSLAELSTALKKRCASALGAGFEVLDNVEDTAGGSHWLLRGAGEGARLVHVSTDGKGLRLAPASACDSALLEKPKSPKDKAGNKTAHEEPGLLTKTNTYAARSFGYVMSQLKEMTKTCPDDAQVVDAKLLSAQSAVVDGLEVRLSMRLQGKGETPKQTYHTLTVVWEAKSEERLVPHVTLPRRADNSQVAWCELMALGTDTALTELADTEGHDAVEEYHQKLGYLGSYSDTGVNPDSLLEKAEVAQCATSYPADFSYRGHPTFGRCVNADAVTNQGSCGSCWAFAVSHAASARACMQFPDEIAPVGGTRKHFSVQEILSCNVGKQGCDGGWMGTGFTEFRKGIPWANEYVYSPRSGSFPWQSLGLACQWGNYVKPYVSDAPYGVQTTVAAFQAELFCNGPFTVAYDVYQNFFNYRSGVYTSTGGTANAGGHAVTLVGWGTLNGVNYWELMNSWGKEWGDGGYFKFLRGTNLCNIESAGNSAARIRKVAASWVYDNWQPCVNGTKKRGIKCVAHDRTPSADANCPVVNSWPAKSTFPRALASTSTFFAEMAPVAVSNECSVGGECDLSYCNGYGTVSKAADGSCVCSCLEGYAAPFCNQCQTGYEGFPTCRLKCTRTDDCSGNGAAFGVKWRNEFGALLSTCSCACDAGWTGATCNVRGTTSATTAAPTTAPASTTRPATATTTVAPVSGQPLQVSSGPCTVDASGCVQSGNFPNDYSINEACVIQISGTRQISSTAFDTERLFDVLTVAGINYSGTTGPQGVTASGQILWQADDSIAGKGWRICAA